jgi:hypothetical protein
VFGFEILAMEGVNLKLRFQFVLSGKVTVKQLITWNICPCNLLLSSSLWLIRSV